MGEWLEFLTRGRLLEVALALALGSAAAELARSVADASVTVVAQHAGNDLSEGGAVQGLLNIYYGPYYLHFSVGSTIVVYGTSLSALLALGLIALAALVVVKRRLRAFAKCPFCASRIPHESTHCAYCGSAVGPDEP